MDYNVNTKTFSGSLTAGQVGAMCYTSKVQCSQQDSNQLKVCKSNINE